MRDGDCKTRRFVAATAKSGARAHWPARRRGSRLPCCLDKTGLASRTRAAVCWVLDHLKLEGPPGERE